MAISSIGPPWRAFIRQRFWRWIIKRAPAANSHHLSLKNIYVLPTKRGGLFALFIAVFWLLGTNYQNNLILALAFLLISVFIVAILHSFKNLVHVQFVWRGANEVFAGDNVAFTFLVSSGKNRWSEAIELSLHDDDVRDQVEVTCVNLPATVGRVQSQLVSVYKKSVKRGYLPAGRMKIQTVYPLGLWRCWSWLHWSGQALVYPAPKASPRQQATVDDDAGDGAHPVRGGEDFSSLRTYHPGDSLKWVAWKTFARGQALQVKQFSQNISEEHWLDFTTIGVSGVEAKLSALTFWALEFYRDDECYGLKLPGISIAPNRGELHRRYVLDALASFAGSPEIESSTEA